MKLDEWGYAKNDAFYFTAGFNLPLTNKILKKLKQFKIIKFNEDFNQPINNLHEGLEELFLCSSFNQDIKKIPSTLKKLTIRSAYFDKDILINKSNLIYLKLEIIGLNYFEGEWVRNIVNYDKRMKLPGTLMRLELGGFNDISFEYLPDSLEELLLFKIKSFNKTLDYLPGNLRFLSLVGYNINGFFEPEYVEHMPKLFCDFNQPLDHLPEKLEKLVIKHMYYFNRSLDYLPEGLRELDLCMLKNFNQSLDYLPKGLRSLSLCDLSAFKGYFDYLPENLEFAC